jgi:AcrR family transcriptional regulator
MSPDSGARRTQAERRNDSEEALLAAAAELIAERGIERASLAGIGERAGASRGLPTHYFGSKDVLVARLARHAQDAIEAAMIEAVAQTGPRFEELTARARLCAAVDLYLARFEDPTPQDRALLVVWGATFPSTSSVDGMAAADRRSYEGWADAIVAGQRDGSIRADLDPAATAMLIAGMIRGVAGVLLADPDAAAAADVRGACRAWITGALGP